MTITSKLLYYRGPRLGSRSAEREDLEIDAPDVHDGDAHRLSRLRRGGRGRSCGSDHDDRDHSSSSQRHFSHGLIVLSQKSARNSGQDRDRDIQKGRSSKGRHKSSRVNRSNVIGDDMDDRLPCSVLLARARLVERLKTFHLAEYRQQSLPSGISLDEHNYAEELRVDDYRDRNSGVSTELLESGHSIDTSSLQINRVSSFRDMAKRPSSHSVHWLQEEIFVDAEEGDGTPKAQLECAICLERFLNGDWLIRLQCDHRFHHACLHPWLLVHVVCPYCRSSVLRGSLSQNVCSANAKTQDIVYGSR